MDSSLKKRLITAFIALPLLFVSIFFFPNKNHLLFSIIIIFASVSGFGEGKNSVMKKKRETPITAYLGFFLPIVELIKLNYFPNIELTMFALASFIAFSFFVEIFNGAKDNYQLSLNRISAVVLNIIYPGLLMSYGIRICYLEEPTKMILIFLCLVFGSDTLAYFTGMLFGKNNKGFVKCSPNKSVAGFIGGTLLVALIGLVISLASPSVIPFTPLDTFLLFLLTAIFGTCGDLFESMLKRATGVKDSGVMVPGRGGMLDCIDSISVAAPIFVIAVEFIKL